MIKIKLRTFVIVMNVEFSSSVVDVIISLRGQNITI